MTRRGQISIDRIVALRSSVLPLYVLIRPDGSVTTADEVSEDGHDFLTTRMDGDQISFQSIRGHFLSSEGDRISTKRYCSNDEKFTVERVATQYAFRTRSGKYLNVLDHAPWVDLADSPGELELFQLFSLMMCGVNVGKQMDILERTGSVQISNLLDGQQLDVLRNAVASCGGLDVAGVHDVRVSGLAGRSPELAQLAVHPLVMQLALRTISPSLRLSDMESCCTNADHVRKELETTTWEVVHPYSSVDSPGIVDPRASFTANWFIDNLEESNSTWAWVKAPLVDGAYLPKLPQLSSPEEIKAVTRAAQPLRAAMGSVWLYVGPAWTSNNVGAASFWHEYDAQTRYRHLSGQKEQGSFRALADEQRGAPAREELCPTVLQATYVREYVSLRNPLAADIPEAVAAGLSDLERADVQRLA